MTSVFMYIRKQYNIIVIFFIIETFCSSSSSKTLFTKLGMQQSRRLVRWPSVL